jgi:hypothetical protein
LIKKLALSVNSEALEFVGMAPLLLLRGIGWRKSQLGGFGDMGWQSLTDTGPWRRLRRRRTENGAGTVMG